MRGSRLYWLLMPPADNFDDYWRVASKITPTTSPARATSPTPVPPSSASAHTRPPSVDPGSALPDRDGAYAVRSVPVRFYLPDGPVLQEVIPPVSDDGTSIYEMKSHKMPNPRLDHQVFLIPLPPSSRPTSPSSSRLPLHPSHPRTGEAASSPPLGEPPIPSSRASCALVRQRWRGWARVWPERTAG